MENESETLVKWNPASQDSKGDLLVKSRLYNAVLYDAVKRSGLTQEEYANSLGFNVNFLSQFITLRGSPWYQNSYKHGEPRPQAEKIALHLEMPFDELFPRSLYALRDLLPVSFLSRRYVSTELVPLIEARNVRTLENPSTLYERKELEELVKNSLSSLTPREQDVVKMRFGLEGNELELGKVGEHLGVSRERVRQIEAKALRKLRHPSRSKPLLDFLAIERGGKFKPLPTKESHAS